MSKLYIFEIASALIAVLLLVVDGRHMMIDPPEAPAWASMQRTPEGEYLLSAQATIMQRADAIDQVNALSMLVFAGAAHSRVITQ